ncbi:catalytic domain of ctd-like phosphatase [Rhizoctonia solani]|uniref:Catalytic domain of ctd-like phosphatase n=1 Tax=Rhizoctonia solani TaxID=456999 RepID=A0A8H7LI33_9AGAM|nr:catalytic domain of ctd-like phosphatase [Rhizoctonia solani]
MSADYDLTTPTGLTGYLSSTPYACTYVDTLSGGCLGFLYRVTLKRPLRETGERTVVVKHSVGYASTTGPEGLSLKAERMDFEYNALKLVSSNLGLSTVVGVPHVHAYDPRTHTLIMSDLAPFQLLSNALQEGGDKVVSRIGRALGEFMGRFHKWTSLPEHADTRKRFLENEASREDLLDYRWKLAISGAKRYGLGHDWMAEMRDEGMRDAKLGGPVVCMGDFWCSNILVSTGGDLKLYIIDWETARTARPEFDLAQLVKDAYTLSHVRRPMPFMREFFKAYTTHMHLDKAHLALNVGRDLLSFGIDASWLLHSDGDVKRSIAQTGLELLEAARTGDKKALSRNPALADMYRI